MLACLVLIGLYYSLWKDTFILPSNPCSCWNRL
jgi:hypothetical protein